MARVRGARLAVESLAIGVAAAADPESRTALELLARLYATQQVSADGSWYARRGLLSDEAADDLPAALDRLCAALVPHVGLLTEAMELTPELLRAPIAADDYMEAFIRASKEQSAMKTHLYRCPLRWADMDVYGVVNNVAYLRYLEEARVDFIFRLGPTDGDAFFRDGSVVVRHEIAYKNRLSHRHRPVDIEMWVSDLGSASVTIDYRVQDDEAGPRRVVYAVASTTMAPFDYAAGRPRRLTEFETEFFTGFMAAGEPECAGAGAGTAVTRGVGGLSS